MLRDIFEKNKIEYFSALNATTLEPGNERLYNCLPEGNLNVIFFLVPYYVPDTDSRLSKYGAVRDYHLFNKNLFFEIEEYLNDKYPDKYSKGYSDHSPFGEVKGASRAGLGKVGTNGLLISEKYSSFVFISEIVTNIGKDELENEGISFHEGNISRCEDCGACKNACPIFCPEHNRVGCISDVTQKKEDLTPDEENAIKSSGYIWGCDICQNVCPHTKKAIKSGTIITPIEFFHEGKLIPDAFEKIKEMDKETFSKYPFSWRRKKIIERNISIFEK